jgi:hypothetical protein
MTTGSGGNDQMKGVIASNGLRVVRPQVQLIEGEMFKSKLITEKQHCLLF